MDKKTMKIHLQEAALVEAFVIKSKRDRLLWLLSRPDRRSKALNSLNHFGDWDPNWAFQLRPSDDPLTALTAHGAASTCHIISDSEELDGREMPLVEAVQACEEFFFASVLCCLPGKLAFYFGEVAADRDRLLLRRPRI